MREEENTELENIVQSLQIQVQGLFVQVLNYLDILAEQKQGQQRLQDECHAHWHEVKELHNRPSPRSTMQEDLENSMEE